MRLFRFLALTYGFWFMFIMIFFTIRPSFDSVSIVVMFLSLLACCLIAFGLSEFGSGKK